MRNNNRLVFLVLCCVSSICVLLLLYQQSEQNYDDQWLLINEDIETANIQTDNNIFFVETKLTEFRKLTAHQSCSIESAGKRVSRFEFKFNGKPSIQANIYPEKEIYVAFTTEENPVQLKQTLMIKALRKYKNIHFKYINLKKFAKATPLEAWMADDPLSRSRYRVSHTSDVFRYLILWKYGGSYYDLDVIVMKPLNRTNYVCFQDDNEYIASGIIKLTGAVGKDLAAKFLDNQMRNFDGWGWGNNGPDVIMRVMQELCPQKGFPSECGGLTLLPRNSCYEITYPEWQKFFNEDHETEVRERTNESYFIHLWNKMANNQKISVLLDSHAAIIDFAKLSCPRVFHSRYDDF